MVKRFVCIKVLHEDGEHASPTHCRVVAEIDYDALAARLAKAERDAARYRWLRNTPIISVYPCIRVFDRVRGLWRFVAGTEADQFIDAAMASETVSEVQK